MSPASRTSRCTRSSTAGRSPRASRPPRAATSWRCATRASSTRCSTSRSCARCRATWRSPTSATRRPAPTRGRTRSPSGAPTGARSRSATTATSSTRSSCTPSCKDRGVSFRSTSDSEIIAALLSTHPAETIEDAVEDVLPRLEGAFSTVVMTKDRVVAFRDPAGLRPLALGLLGERYCVASESCAFDIIGAQYLREVQPGEMVSLTERGHRDAPGRHGRAARVLRLRAHLLRAARTRGSRAASCRRRAGAWARSSPPRRRATRTS